MESLVHQHPKDGGFSKGQGEVNHLSSLDKYQWNDDMGEELTYEGIITV